jgi:hypothetical protein
VESRQASNADQELIEYAARRGYTVSARQLERWRQGGLIPCNVRRGLGRGRGTKAISPPGSKRAVLRVARYLRKHGRLPSGPDEGISRDRVRKPISKESV